MICEGCFAFCCEPTEGEIYLYISQPTAIDNIKLSFVHESPFLHAAGPAKVPPIYSPEKCLRGETSSRLRYYCDGCMEQIPSEEIRYRCADCFDTDFCSKCFRSRQSEHNSRHAFYVSRSNIRFPQRNLLSAPNTSISVCSLSEAREMGRLDELVALENTSFHGFAWGKQTLESRHSPERGWHIDCFFARRRGELGEDGVAAPDTEELAAYVCYLFSSNHSNLHVASVAVKPGWQGHGLGRLIVMHALQQARNERRCATIELHVNQTNERALNLYLTTGFEVVDEIPRYYGADGDAFLMRMVIRAESAVSHHHVVWGHEEEESAPEACW